jgi:hypothetical protein
MLITVYERMSPLIFIYDPLMITSAAFSLIM